MQSRVPALVAAVLASPGALAAVPSEFPASLKQLSLEELLEVEISTASRYAIPRSQIPAPAYVITQDEIRRSGARTIPEALRLAPGVEVAQEGSYSWNVSMRGFNGDLSNKLLVLIDGRSVYSPLFAGVFWDVQDYLLEDVERIEVVGGPGGTLWGSNAVNGVINIITRSPQEMPGAMVYGGSGNEEPVLAGARIAGELGGGWHGRGYLKYFERDPARLVSGQPGVDQWDMARGGFRFDRDDGVDAWTIQGDLYGGSETSVFDRDFTLGMLPTGPVVADIDLGGANLLGRWSRKSDSGSELQLQFYFDRTQRDIPQTYDEDRNTWDLDFQHRLPIGERQDFMWGAGLRLSEDSIGNSAFAAFVPPDRSDWTFSAFAQDRIDLWQDRLLLTVGSKFEHNDYTGWEVQPTVSLTALVSEVHTLWATASRAVRIPARLDHDLLLTVPIALPGVPVPLVVQVAGSDDFDSERLLAYEAGWRAELPANLTLDLSAYLHEYEDLQTQDSLSAPFVVPGPPTYLLLPAALQNGKDAEGHGATLAATWQPSDTFRLQLNYTYFDLEVTLLPVSANPEAFGVEGDSPEHQAGLFGYLDLARDVSLFAGLRYVDELPSQGVPDYVAFDANVIWRASEHLELSLSGRNLFDPGHLEFGSDMPREIERTWYARASWRY
jgi:iron complex outermembrane recepter protein